MMWKGEGCLVCSVLEEHAAKPMSADAQIVAHVAMGAVLVAVGPSAFANAVVTACSKHHGMLCSALGQLSVANAFSRERQIAAFGCSIVKDARSFDA